MDIISHGDIQACITSEKNRITKKNNKILFKLRQFI
jgi:hypothetical protein